MMITPIIWLIVVLIIISIGLGYLKTSGIPMEGNTARTADWLIKLLCGVVIIVVIVMLVMWLLSILGINAPNFRLP